MRIVIAPDSYKGSFSALSVAQAMAQGVRRVFHDAAIVQVPIADGGEGTVEALITATSGVFCQTVVTGPLGEPVTAQWGILGNRTMAVIEMAAASGLPLVPPDRRNPRLTTTRGVGELIRAALDCGLRHLLIGIGGSATNDGGVGMAEALGAQFLDTTGEPLSPGGAALSRLATIDLSGLDSRLRETQVHVACDVDNPLCGPHGASAVYGPQKGATPAMVAELDKALRHYGSIATQTFGRDVTEQAGAGAAGGLGAALLWFANACLQPGIDLVIEATGLRTLIREADWVITGEGITDYQTVFGKAPSGIAKVAQEFDVPVVCLSGGLGRGYQAIYTRGMTAAASIIPYPMTLEACLAAGPALLEDAAERLARLIAVGIRIAPRP